MIYRSLYLDSMQELFSQVLWSLDVNLISWMLDAGKSCQNSLNPGHILRRYNFIDEDCEWYGDMYLSLFQPAANFNVWFGTSVNQENEYESIPPYFMALN